MKFLFLFSFLLISNTSEAQRLRMENLPKYDRQRVHFGFVLGMNSADFIVKPIADFSLFDSLKVIEGKPQMGFNLGIVSDLKIGSNLNLRFIPTLAFSSRFIEYTFVKRDSLKTRYTKPVNIESTFIEFPLMLKFKSVKHHNWRVYVIGGGKFAIDLASQDKKQSEDPTAVIIKLQDANINFELGVGFDIYLEYFKFSPELKMSYGVNNIMVYDANVYTDAIKRLQSKLFNLSFYFE